MPQETPNDPPVKDGREPPARPEPPAPVRQKVTSSPSNKVGAEKVVLELTVFSTSSGLFKHYDVMTCNSGSMFRSCDQTSVHGPGRRSPAAGVRRLGEQDSMRPSASTSQFTLLHSVFKGERESPSSRRTAGPSHRRHVRTIQEVRTTITRIITDVYYEDGKEVERKVSEVRGALGQEQGRGKTFVTRPLLFGAGVTRRARSPWWTARCWTATSRRAAQAAAP